MNYEFKEGQEVWVKGKVEDGIIIVFDEPIFKEDFPYVDIRTDLPEKPIIPPFVAEWYEENKMDLEYNLYLYQISMYEETVDKSDFFYWMQKSVDPIKTLINMHQFGYKVKQPPLYTVEIPNPNDKDFKYTVLWKVLDGGVVITKVDNEGWKHNHHYQLTEEEIKKDFEWAWKWAKPVEEEE